MLKLEHEICYRALQARDARFDGQFFTAVRTTGIYCRPICPAPTPRSENCVFMPNAAAAQEAGFRPCLRCRPEISPNLALSLEAAGAIVTRALRFIAEGALDEGTVTELATRLGVTERHLRRLFIQYLGASPSTVAQTRRILFAKQLLDETSLPIIEVALAAGFSSLRRFNAVMQQTYQRPPRELRKKQKQTTQLPEVKSSSLSLKLPFSPPYNWEALVSFLQPRMTAGVEAVGPDYYRRTIKIEGLHGIIEVRPVPGQAYLLANIYFPKVIALTNIVERLRHMFDLGANITEIASHLGQDSYPGRAVSELPGLRVPGTWDRFELAVRAILGQQVSVAAATTLAGRLAETYGEPLVLDGCPYLTSELRYVFPQAAVLAAADLSQLGLPRARAEAISALAAAVEQNKQLLENFSNLDEAIEKLCELPGIGVWTAQYIAMRALREPDAFPATDLGLLRAIAWIEQPMTAAQLLNRAQGWRPWRAYAAMYLWSARMTRGPDRESPDVDAGVSPDLLSSLSLTE